jgi:hypothetical protein
VVRRWTEWVAAGRQAAAAISNAKLPVAIKLLRTDIEMDMRSSPGAEDLGTPFSPLGDGLASRRLVFLGAIVGQMAPRAQAGSRHMRR